MYNSNESAKAQEKYCTENKIPHFAPSSGVCWRCRKDIYQPFEKEGYGGKKYTTGVTTVDAGKKLITGCPHCNISYCD